MGGKWDKWYYYKPDNGKVFAATEGEEATEWSPIGFLLLVLALGVLAAIGILAWQIYSFLKFGQWTPLSVINALHWCNIEWASSPQDWKGVHAIIDALPLSVAALFLGAAPMTIWLQWSERAATKRIDA